MFSGRYWSCIQDFQDLIRRIFIILGTRLFEIWQHFGLPTFWDVQKYCFPNKSPGFFLNFLSVLASPEIKTIGFGARGHVPKSRNQRNEGFEFSISKSTNYYTKSKQNNSLELLNLLFKHISHKNNTKNANRSPNCFLPVFAWLSCGSVQFLWLLNYSDFLRNCSGTSLGQAWAMAHQTATGPPRQAPGPPRSGAEEGIGMLRGVGDSPLFSWFLVSCFLLSWFQSFLFSEVSKIQWSHITNKSFHVSRKILVPYPSFSRSY